ncbi:hypothetical protein [Cytobacillus oceanisediminis]|uniref:hypothetical protein n=1 Tax=Cytobacillus oceanisediminis TaxID=665099 RepID=UPI001C221B17|nr:hypothetical protein [Cytobacillus oceanisediminis]MBU8768605.1 hypothetical protein [Cytobacillus oceanisediminis]
MENQFQILVDSQRLAALIQPSDIKLDRAVHPEDLHKLLADEKITFGMSEEVNQVNLQKSFLSGISHSIIKRNSCRKRQ